MKLQRNISRNQNQAGITLIECLVYVTVLIIIVGVALEAFYVCWGHSRALISTTDDVSAALRAGELWRADVRDASGAIDVETTASGEAVKIPEAGKEIRYTFNSSEVRRQTGSEGVSQLLLARVKSSDIKMDPRTSVTAWKWELELPERTKGPHLPLLFTFEAVEQKQ
jgi:hypothetical protein